MSKYEKHIFICTNRRPDDHPKGSCAQKGGNDLRDEFRAELRRHGLNTRMRANASGCLDVCEYGCAVVVYPDAVWYGGVDPSDVPEIVESHLVKGVPVERLRIFKEGPNDG